jgi:hypothetical protein
LVVAGKASAKKAIAKMEILSEEVRKNLNIGGSYFFLNKSVQDLPTI